MTAAVLEVYSSASDEKRCHAECRMRIHAHFPVTHAGEEPAAEWPPCAPGHTLPDSYREEEIGRFQFDFSVSCDAAIAVVGKLHFRARENLDVGFVGSSSHCILYLNLQRSTIVSHGRIMNAFGTTKTLPLQAVSRGQMR